MLVSQILMFKVEMYSDSIVKETLRGAAVLIVDMAVYVSYFLDTVLSGFESSMLLKVTTIF